MNKTNDPEIANSALLWFIAYECMSDLKWDILLTYFGFIWSFEQSRQSERGVSAEFNLSQRGIQTGAEWLKVTINL